MKWSKEGGYQGVQHAEDAGLVSSAPLQKRKASRCRASWSDTTG